MVAHLDAVTSLAVDPNGLYLMSGSKYLLTTIRPNLAVTESQCHVKVDM